MNPKVFLSLLLITLGVAGCATPAGKTRAQEKGETVLTSLATNIYTLLENGTKEGMAAYSAELKEQLKLNSEQHIAIREILDKDLAAWLSAVKHLLLGELSAQDEEVLRGDSFSDEKIKAVLTPEQKVAYDRFQTEQRMEAARRTADAELKRLQPELKLEPEQRERVRSLLIEQEQLSRGDHAPGTPGPTVAELEAKKAEALRPVLTQKQFTLYQKLNLHEQPTPRNEWFQFMAGVLGGYQMSRQGFR